ncbi:MAG: glutamyl-tRNA reductase [Candidatus Omnitrophica bacterium CG1_02_44_16]|nr:MAG: glutamyl-tRNA reductase [Candidatus Omnitrophica bacterium CG1_02_44_16]PIY81998.1 MAG: glutamyl-tRNA reductase [Candidatus Omnitrophica bacterium CG_4_10_14_0_8_um_filter_44_12]PIZ83563.1 MAG: glutamyl-tRNA reductase [Candidatus Omnitrophica bacterium CG_4_10_14_0_2_um_filter_44_9]
MNLTLVGINYKYAHVSLREIFYFSKKDIFLALQVLFEKGAAKGAVILSTCQRTEIYAQAEDITLLRSFLLAFKNTSELPADYFYIKKNEDAVTHLFTVSAGLDSLIIGEREILHQVKEAYFLAKRFEATTPFLNKIFERALFVGKQARKNTAFFQKDPSLAKAAVSMAKVLSGDIAAKNIFIIGAGTVAVDISGHCAKIGAAFTIVSSRTLQKAKSLALRFGQKAISIREFYERLDEADIVFSATASPHLILQREAFEQKRRSIKPLLLFDLALPRDIDPSISGVNNVRLFNVDDLAAQPHADLGMGKALQAVREKAQRFLCKLERSRSASGQACLR